MKMVFKGSYASIKSQVIALADEWRGASPVAPIIPEASVAEALAPEPAPSEASPPIGIAEEKPKPPSIRERVLAEIKRHPSVTGLELARLLHIDLEQVRGALKHFIRDGVVDKLRSPEGVVYQPYRYMMTKAGEKDIKRNRPALARAVGVVSPTEIIRQKVIEFALQNPGKTSGEMARALDLSQKHVSSTLTKLAAIRRARTTGAGGNRDPYRYFIDA